MITDLIEKGLSLNDLSNFIKIEVFIESSLDEEMNETPISKNVTLEDIIDDVSFDHWCNFESAIQEFIQQNYIIDNISMSKNIQSLSEYIDFYALDNYGNKKSTIVNLRLSNHRGNNNSFRIKKLKQRLNNPNQKYHLVGITVNGETFTTYKEAFKHAKEVIEEACDTVD